MIYIAHIVGQSWSGMSDLINRQDAIDAVHYYIESGYKCDIFQELKNLPSVEPEQKKGMWKSDESGDDYWICSVCGFASEAFGANILYHFCPSCGADMRMRGK